jgi:hypothetical protein
MQPQGVQHRIRTEVAPAGQQIHVVADARGIPLPPPGSGAGLKQGDEGGDQLFFWRDPGGGPTLGSGGAGSGSNSHRGASAGPQAPARPASRAGHSTH